MTPTPAPGAKSLDFKKSLLETFFVNEKANQYLISNVPELAWHAVPPSGKGRSIFGIAGHIHNVRLMWLGAADKTQKLPPKLEADKASPAEIQFALKSSAEAIGKLIQKALDDPAGKVPNFKPDVVGFVGYLIAHDSHHRGQISMLARQVGHPLSAKAGFGLWEWGTLWKDSGFAK
jgi:uncharacterized damage-inducible protein DinB